MAQNFDAAPGAPQVARIEFARILIPDETAGAPDEHDDGFWPSADPEAASYIGEGGDLEAAKAKAQARYDAWEADEWGFVGVICRATVHVPIGGGSFCRYSVDSAGLWGVESDSDESYLASVFEEERATLTEHLAAIGAAATELLPKEA